MICKMVQEEEREERDIKSRKSNRGSITLTLDPN
jgi:hypothetical protein